MLFFARYVLPGIMFVGAFVMLAIAPTRSIGIDGFAMGMGGALALVLMNALWRFGFSGDDEREAEEEARRYLMKHGHWPDEEGSATMTVVPPPA